MRSVRVLNVKGFKSAQGSHKPRAHRGHTNLCESEYIKGEHSDTGNGNSVHSTNRSKTKMDEDRVQKI